MFTRGPWIVDKVTYPRGQDVSFEVIAGCRFIGQTLMREVATEAELIVEDEANAQLISAAPDLYAACDAFDQVWSLPVKDRVAQMEAAIAATRTALAKARGQL